MVRPNFIPRTLKGLGGKRYIDIPGVSYPDELFIAKEGHCPLTGRFYEEKQQDGLSTREAAHILRSSLSSARAILHKYKIGYRIVCKDGRPPIIYWNGEEVEDLAEKKPQCISPDESPHLMGIVEAANYIGVGRSTIQRAIAKGKLGRVYARVASEKGTRVRCFLRRSEVVKMRQERRAEELRREQRTVLYPPS